MVVRELIAMFGIDFNPAGAKKAESALDGLKSLAGKVGLALSAGAIAKGMFGLVEMAAQVADTMSLLKTTFGTSAEAVTAWAKANADALGRSEYKLREYATALGVVAQGLTGSEKDAAKIGTTFAQLAVDMKAFFPGKTDLDALGALRSALTGETEPMKQFGVVMDEASLAAYALRQSNGRLWKDMSAAEKTMVRFNFIMANPNMKKAWGSSARESDQFSARVERLKNKAEDLGIKLGMVLLPAAQKFLDVLVKLSPAAAACADAVEYLAEQTYFFEGAMLLAGLVTGVKFINFLIRLHKLIRAQVLFSLIGLFTNLATVTAWLGTAATATWAFIAAWAPIVGIVLGTIALAAAIAAAGIALAQTIATGTNFIADLSEEWLGLQTLLVKGIGYVHDFFKWYWGGIYDLVMGVLNGIREKIAEVLPQGVLNLLAKVGLDLTGASAAASARTQAGAVAPPGATVASRNVNVSNGAITVNVNGNATPGTAQQVGKEVQKALDNNNRNLAQTAPVAPV